MWKKGHSEQAKTWVDISTVVPVQNTENIRSCSMFRLNGGNRLFGVLWPTTLLLSRPSHPSVPCALFSNITTINWIKHEWVPESFYRDLHPNNNT